MLESDQKSDWMLDLEENQIEYLTAQEGGDDHSGGSVAWIYQGVSLPAGQTFVICAAHVHLLSKVPGMPSFPWYPG